MHFMLDTINKRECIASIPFRCAYCEIGYSRCNNHNCPFYHDNQSGEKVVYTGDIGSILMELIAIDFDALGNHIYDACSKQNVKNEATDFFSWSENLTANSRCSSFAKMLLYDILALFHFDYIMDIKRQGYRTNSKEEWRKRLRDRIDVSFVVPKCVKKYIEGCVYDESLYDPLMYGFANNYFFQYDIDQFRPLSKLELLFGEIFFGRKIIDLKPENFLNALKQEYNTRLSSTNPLFHGYDQIYSIELIEQLSILSLKHIIEAGYKFKICENCGVPFIPYKRSDAKYCERRSPQDEVKTCREYGARQTWANTLKQDEAAGLYRNIYSAKQMLMKRSPDIHAYFELFERFKYESKQWKSAVKSGAKTEAEYLAWLKDVKEKRV